MPRIVDRAERRREIAETYLTIVARDGMAAATTRNLAHELGVATGALWNYFANFQEMLEQAFDLIFERTTIRIREHVGEKEGLAALVRTIEQIHPLDKTTDDEARVVVSFWGRTTPNAELAVHSVFAEQRWREHYRDRLREAIDLGEVLDTLPTPALADALVVLALGQQVTRALDSPLAEAETQWATVRAVIEPWLTEHGRAVWEAAVAGLGTGHASRGA